MKDKYINIQIPILDSVNGIEVVKPFTEEQLWYVHAIAKVFEELQQENHKYKEVIEKAINFINNNGEKQYNHNDNYRGKWYSPDELNTLEDILKEVE